MTQVKLIWLFMMCHDSHFVVDHYVCPHIAGLQHPIMLIYCAELVVAELHAQAKCTQVEPHS